MRDADRPPEGMPPLSRVRGNVWGDGGPGQAVSQACFFFACRKSARCAPHHQSASRVMLVTVIR